MTDTQVMAALEPTQADREWADKVIAVEHPNNHEAYEYAVAQVIAAHRLASSSPAEPVAWMYEKGDRTTIWRDRAGPGEMCHGNGWTETPLYATPLPPPAGDAEVRKALEGFCVSAECAAGCDEGVTEDQAYSEILSFAGSALAISYIRSREALATPPSVPAQQGEVVEAVRQSMDNAIAQVGADAIRASFFTSVSGGGRYYLSLAYPTMDAMHKAEDEIKAFIRWPRFLPLEKRLAAYAATPPSQDQGEG